MCDTVALTIHYFLVKQSNLQLDVLKRIVKIAVYKSTKCSNGSIKREDKNWMEE